MLYHTHLESNIIYLQINKLSPLSSLLSPLSSIQNIITSLPFPSFPYFPSRNLAAPQIMSPKERPSCTPCV